MYVKIKKNMCIIAIKKYIYIRIYLEFTSVSCPRYFNRKRLRACSILHTSPFGVPFVISLMIS